MMSSRTGKIEPTKSLFEEFLVDVVFFATFGVAWGLASSATTVAWIPLATHVVASVVACAAILAGGDFRNERRDAAIAVVVGWACALAGCVDALIVAQVGCRLWGETSTTDPRPEPSSFSRGIDVSREVDVVVSVGAHLLGLTTCVYRARRAAGSDIGDVDASFVSLGAGFGVAFAYVPWIVLDASFGKWFWHLVVVFVVFFGLGPVADAIATFAPPADTTADTTRRAWCNAGHAFHTIGVVAQYVVVLANVAYLFDVDATFSLFGAVRVTHPYESTCARAQAVGLLVVFACANAHRNGSMLATSGSVRKPSGASRGRTLDRLGEIEPWIAFVVWSSKATSSIVPAIVAVVIAFAENASGLVRFAFLGYATFAWARGKAQTASCGWNWEILASTSGASVDIALAVLLLAWPGFTRRGAEKKDLDDVEKQIVAVAASIDAIVAVAVCASAAWAKTRDDEAKDEANKCK